MCGATVGVFSAAVSGLLAAHALVGVSTIAITGIWRAFVFSLVAVIGVLGTEIKMPEPRKRTDEN
jgi:uncharacterized oligopeptide transporter (OPT) family protein